MSIQSVESSSAAQSDPPSVSERSGAAVDRFAGLLDRFRVRAALFHTGPLCGLHVFDAVPGRAFLHVLRRGAMGLRYQDAHGTVTTELVEPTVILFTRAVHHEFINPPADGPDFTCATLDFDGGARHPVVQALPPVLLIPLRLVDGLAPTLDLLFDEADHMRCGSNVIADRLFEVLLIRLLRWMLDRPAPAGLAPGAMLGLSDLRLSKALVAVHKAPARDWSIEQMASVAGMSRSAFAAAFKDVVGSTPAAYVADWRLGLAGPLLRDGVPLKQVAAELGFADAATLSKAFRRRCGVSPRAWLAQSRLPTRAPQS